LILEENGVVEERGWIHGKMADLLAEEGLTSRAVQADLAQMAEFLREGNLMIASVCYQLGTLSPVTFKGGHLVVVHGADLCDGQVQRLYIHNPSGRYPHLQAHAAIDARTLPAGLHRRVVLRGQTLVRAVNPHPAGFPYHARAQVCRADGKPHRYACGGGGCAKK
jgi:hypothetical protein